MVQPDGMQSSLELQGYVHERLVQNGQPEDADHLLPRPQRVISLLKRWLPGTNQDAAAPAYLQEYLAEFTFRFYRRASASHGKLFHLLAQQAAPSTCHFLSNHNPWGLVESRKYPHRKAGSRILGRGGMRYRMPGTLLRCGEISFHRFTPQRRAHVSYLLAMARTRSGCGPARSCSSHRSAERS